MHYLDWDDRTMSFRFELSLKDLSFADAGGIEAWRLRTLPAFAVSCYCEKRLIQEM